MIKNIIASGIVIALLVSCNNKPADTTATVNTDSTAAPMTPEKQTTQACYTYINKKDTVLLHVTSDGTAVTGTLSYNYFEKDKNTGTLKGRIDDKNLLIADYTFMSEGVESTRQVVFKKSGNTATEGYGDIETKDGKTVYKTIDSLDYSHSSVLKEIDCE